MSVSTWLLVLLNAQPCCHQKPRVLWGVFHNILLHAWTCSSCCGAACAGSQTQACCNNRLSCKENSAAHLLCRTHSVICHLSVCLSSNVSTPHSLCALHPHHPQPRGVPRWPHLLPKLHRPPEPQNNPHFGILISELMELIFNPQIPKTWTLGTPNYRWPCCCWPPASGLTTTAFSRL